MMATSGLARPSQGSMRRLRLGRHRGLLIAILVFVILFLIVDWISPGPISYFEISFLSSGGATLAIAAMGETLVILSGGFDLSAGAVISLVNIVLASNMQDGPGSILLWCLAGVGIGMATGAFNGFFVAFLRLQPIVVTLSTMFIVQGLTLLVLDKPGGLIPPDLTTLLTGDAIEGLLPMPLVLLAALLLLWLLIKNSRLGVAIYAVGGDPEAAAGAGVRQALVLFAVYVMAGGLYGLAGVFVSAQTGSGDPLDRQSDAAPDLRRRRGRRHPPRRRPRRPRGLRVRRLHPDDCRQHPAGPERLGLLQHGRRGHDPDSRGARRLDQPRFQPRPLPARGLDAVRGMACRHASRPTLRRGAPPAP